VIRSNERLGEQVGLGREAVGNGLRELKDLRLIHIEGPAKGKRRVYLHVHPWMTNPEAVPTWVNLPQVEQAACGKLPRQLAASSDKSCGKLRHKEVINNEQEQKHQEPDESITLGNSIPNTSGNASDSVCLEGYQHQNQPAQDHPKWPEFDRYCRGQRDKRGNPGRPTEKGFWTWLNKQNRKWRNTPAPNPDGELGWELNGKFYTQEQATQLGIQDPDLQVKFRRARRRDGKIVIISEPKR
jgi:hypothetical protein